MVKSSDYNRILKSLILTVLAVIIASFFFSVEVLAEGNADGHGSYGYASLKNADEINLYNKINTVVTDFVGSDTYKTNLTDEVIGVAEISVQLSRDDAYRVYYSYYYDNPQYYWMYGGVSVSRSSQAGAGAFTRVSVMVDSDYLTYESRQAADEAISSVSAEWLTELNSLFDNVDGDDDKYKIGLRLHDLIINQIDYRYDGGKPSQKKSAHSLAGVFDGSGVVCEGYARAFQYVLNRLGIDNIYIVGKAAGGGHAWNAIKLDGSYYCVDVTWDDLNTEAYGDGVFYDYFCMPISKFDDKHTPSTVESERAYNMPEFSNDDKYVYYKYFKSYSGTSLDDTSANELVNQAMLNQRGDYLYFVVKTTGDVSKITQIMGINSNSYLQSEFGCLKIAENIVVNNPATGMNLSLSEGSWDTPAEGSEITGLYKEVEVGTSLSINAILQAAGGECDDRLLWQVSDSSLGKLTTNGTTCTVFCRRNGTITLTATAVKGKNSDNSQISMTCTIKIGTGIYEPEYLIWAGGSKDYKAITITPTIKATNWKDSKGKTKSGKLVWVVLDERTDISFDETKHTVTTKSSKSYVSVSGKGKVTAKKAGTAYVYACDTGSLTYECFEVVVKQAPTKIVITADPTKSDKDYIIKKGGLDVGHSARLYIVGETKSGIVHDAEKYQIAFAKSEYSKYLNLSEVQSDADGNIFFSVEGKDIDRTKNKPATVKINITNLESGKKTSLTVYVKNPVAYIEPVATGTSLAKKGDSVSISFKIVTVGGTDMPTTDTMKLYCAEDVWLDDTKVVKEGSTTVKMKYDKSTGVVTLTASKDAGKAACISVAFTDTIEKEVQLFDLATVDTKGAVNCS